MANIVITSTTNSINSVMAEIEKEIEKGFESLMILSTLITDSTLQKCIDIIQKDILKNG